MILHNQVILNQIKVSYSKLGRIQLKWVWHLGLIKVRYFKV